MQAPIWPNNTAKSSSYMSLNDYVPVPLNLLLENIKAVYSLAGSSGKTDRQRGMMDLIVLL